MTTPPPSFGPTEIIGDEEQTPFAIVHLAIALPREQLRAALAIGHAEMAGEPPLPEMSAVDIRREVEGHLGACAVIELDREAASINERLSPELAAELDAAIDRAYIRPEPPQPEGQQPRYGDGVVTLQTIDQGEVVEPEPAWCLGHDDEPVGHFADITHDGRPITAHAVTASHGQIEVAHGYITHAPHGVLQPEPHPVLYIALDLHDSFGPEDGRHVTRALRVAATRFDRALADLARMRGESR
ncbi:DUF6907 domain-containing protein [Streptomyces coeruleorubidus]